MSALLESLSESGRRVARIDAPEGGPRSELVEDDEGRRYLLWTGPKDWMDRIDSLLKMDPSPSPLRPVARGCEGDTPVLLLEYPGAPLEPFDIWKWRNLDGRACVVALGQLAQTIHAVHQAGWSLGGIERSELLFDPRNERLILAGLPRLGPLDGECETIWRDIRIFAALSYENFLEHEYPGGHQLVSLLQDRTAMAETGIIAPGLSQLLAGCVTPYGDLAYGSVEDLLDGLKNLRRELTRPLTYQVGSRSTQGNHIFRQNNQDSCGHVVVDTTCGSQKMRFGFFCVADGIGGIDDGERASALAVKTACSAFLRAWNYFEPQKLRRNPVAFARAIAQVTSQRLSLEGNFAPQKNRGGTTFTGLLLAGDRAGLCHVGDSRALLIRNARPVPLTRDHTLASILEQLGELPANEEDDAANHRTIARFLSTGAELDWSRIDAICASAAEKLQLSRDQRWVQGFSIQRGDLFLLTSDGAHGEVDQAGLMRILPLHRDDPQALCDALIHQALRQIGRDNATALAVSVQ